MKVLIGAPVRQNKIIFNHYLNSLRRLNGDFDLFFLLHNSKNLSKYLKSYEYEHCESPGEYIAHNWSNTNLSDVARMKNMLLEKALKENYDYFFLVDSDTVLHPDTLVHLLSRKKDIVAEVLWTKWKKDLIEMPNAWDVDFYSFKNRTQIERKTTSEKIEKIIEFMKTLGITNDKFISGLNDHVHEYLVSIGLENDASYQAFRSPGIYKVGGIGGCNLISRKVIESGVNYTSLYNLSWTNWEDRAFCVRAVAAGFDIYLDTCYPATHLYNDEYLKKYEATLST